MRSHPEATPYHQFAWKLAVEKAYRHRCYYLYAERDTQLAGILPLVHIHLPGIVNELTALPYCDLGNCLADDDRTQDLLVGEALTLQQKLNSKKLCLRGSLRGTQLTNKEVHAEATGKVRMLLDLPTTSEELFSSFKSKLRSQVRKAEKNGIVFQWGGPEDIDAIYSVFSKNMHALGSPVHSKSWLLSILKYYSKSAKVGLAEFEGNIIGMGIILIGSQTVSIPWASVLRSYNRLGPNMILYWNFLKYSADNGYQTFDFGRSTKGEGTYKFKQQWGAQPRPLAWYSCSEIGKVGAPVQQNIAKRSIAADIWRKIPLPVANRIGPFLRKYISL